MTMTTRISLFSLVLTLFLLGQGIHGYGQQDNLWYFGNNAALSFQNAGALPVPQVLNNSAMISAEASAAIADNAGNLLFYTNGREVYNRNHQLMFNGDGLTGHPSACQIVVVPQPGSETIFYIFTADAFENDLTNGYNYSIVDMTGDGGLGNVISKNNPLWASGTERITAVRHANGTDIWIITNDKETNIFRAWPLTCAGLQLNASVVSTIGAVMNQHALMSVGVLKASPDGQFLCQTHFPFSDANSTNSNFFQFFDFNNATGVISNVRQITMPSSQYNHCEFSPDSKLLYVTRKNNKQLDQFDISVPTTAAIMASRISIPTTNSYYDLQLAPDEKIYVSQANSQLAVIKFPNIRGTGCTFERNVINLNPGSAFVGLPSHINDIVASNNPGNGFDFTIQDSCTGRVQFTSATTLPGNLTWEWDFGDNATSALQNPVHVFPNPAALYTVKLKITSSLSCGILVRARNIRPSGMIKPVAGFTHLFRCDSNFVRFTNTSMDTAQPGIRYLWDFGDNFSSTLSNPVHSYLTEGSYDVKLKIITGTACNDDSVSYPVQFSRFSINITPDQTINYGQTVTLNTDVPADSYDWSPGKWLSDSTIRNPVVIPEDNIRYTFIARSGDCTAYDTVNITVIQNDFLYIPTAFTPNADGKNDIIRPLINGRYQLKDFSIYNRNGEKVYTTSVRGNGWDGRIGGLVQNTGVYVWMLQATAPDGRVLFRKGQVTLIR